MNSRKKARFIAKSMASVLKRKVREISFQESSYIKEIAKKGITRQRKPLLRKSALKALKQ